MFHATHKVFPTQSAFAPPAQTRVQPQPILVHSSSGSPVKSPRGVQAVILHTHLRLGDECLPQIDDVGMLAEALHADFILQVVHFRHGTKLQSTPLRFCFRKERAREEWRNDDQHTHV